MMDYRRIVLWIIAGGATLLFAFILFSSPLRRDAHFSSSAASSPTLIPAPAEKKIVNDHKDTDLIQNPIVNSKQSELAKKELPLLPPHPPTDQAAIETHRRLVVGLDREIREMTRRMYEGAFHQLQLPKNQQEKVIDILTQPQKQLEQQAFNAAQSGSIPAPPLPEELQAQQAQQDQQLRSVLGDAGFTAFNQYRATIPDRITIDDMNQQGANLSEGQSKQLLQILGQERQQIQAGMQRNLGSMSPDQAATTIQRQQVLLQQAVSNRVQNVMTPDQATMLQAVLSQQLPSGPKIR